MALGGWRIKEAIATKGGTEASVPRFLGEQARATRHFYGELRDLVASTGLTILTGDAAKAARRAAESRPGAEPHSVEERKVA
jgi:hypothetical protein